MFVYLLKMYHCDVPYYKIGITESPTDSGRFKRFKKYNYSVVGLWETDTDKAKYIEVKVKSDFKYKSINFPEDILGKTEFFKCCDGICEVINNLIKAQYKLIDSSFVYGKINNTFLKSANKILFELGVNEEHIDFYKIVINFYVVNMLRTEYFNSTHMSVGIASENSHTSVKVTTAKFLKVTKHLEDNGYLEMVKGFGRTKTVVCFTDKFKSEFPHIENIHKLVNKRNLEL